MQNIEAFAKKILEELKKSKYGICNTTYNRLQNLYSNMFVIPDDFKGNIVMQTYDSNTKIGIVDISNLGPCFVLQHAPVSINGIYESVRPVIKVANFSDCGVYKSSVYHELSHLFSIADWEINENVAIHYSGIMQEKYQIKQKQLIRTSQSNYYLADEVNDWVAMTLFKAIEKEEYHFNRKSCKSKNMGYIQNQIETYNGCTPYKFIGYYFSNDIDAIRSILCSDEFKTFSKLEQFFS